MKQLRKRLTYANVMSSIAVFLVLGGATAVAATKIGTKEIKGNSITTGKIKKEAVSAAKIKKNAISTVKIQNGAVTGAKVNLGSLGTVPNATHANSADNANTVGGQSVTKIHAILNEGQAGIPIATVAGFKFSATCNSPTDADVFLESPVGPGTVMQSVGAGPGAGATIFAYSAFEAGQNGTIQLDSLGGGGDATWGGFSVAASTSTGPTLSGVLGFDYDTFGSENPDRCIVYGQLISG